MDGPVIQEAMHRALTGGTRVTDVLRTVEAVAGAGVPTLVMTYWNPVDHYGVAAFARDLAAAGGSGLITPDLTPEEAGAVAGRRGRARPGPGLPGRAELVGRADRADHLGLPRLRLRGVADGHHRGPGRGRAARRPGWSAGSGSAPACRSRSGLGVRDGGQAAEVAGFADGVIVGSAFVQRLLAAPDAAAGLAAVRELAAELAAGVRAAAPARG